jgi:hypothetical protein
MMSFHSLSLFIRVLLLPVFLLTAITAFSQVPKGPDGLLIDPYPRNEKYLQEKSFFLQNSSYILYIDAITMEDALAQMVRFYERKGWARTNPLKYSGQPLIYEEADLPRQIQAFPTEVRTRHIRIATEYLTTKTRNFFKTRFLEGNVLVVYKGENSVLMNTELPRIKNKVMTVGGALNYVVALINQENRSVRIRYEEPETIRIRGMEESDVHPYLEREVLMYAPLKKNVLNMKITLDLSAHKNGMDALAKIIAEQPIPYYITLRPEKKGKGYTHVLRLDTLPAKVVKKFRLEDRSSRLGHYYDWWYIPGYKQF